MSNLRVSGRLRVFDTDRYGSPIRCALDQRNLVVNAGIDAMIRRIGGGDAAYAPASMLIGTTLIPSTPAPADVVATAGVLPTGGDLFRVFRIDDSTLTVSIPSPGVLRISGTLPAGSLDAPANPITCEYILARNGELMARVNLITPINTTSTTGKAFVHDITLARM